MRSLVLLFALSAAACGAPDAPADASSASLEPTLDGDLIVTTAEEAVRLGDHRGHVLVMQLAPAGDDAWAAFSDAAPDLEAEGASLLGIVTEGRLDDASALPFPIRHADGLAWAHAIGFTGEPLTVVVGPGGRLRGRGVSATADEIVMLAAPVLLEQDGVEDAFEVGPLTATAVEGLVRRGAALFDVRAEGAPLAHALAVPFVRLAPELLPPDLATPLVFVGPDAAEAAALAGAWGYAEAHALTDPTGLEMAAPIDELPAYDARDDLPRVRG